VVTKVVSILADFRALMLELKDWAGHEGITYFVVALTKPGRWIFERVGQRKPAKITKLLNHGLEEHFEAFV